MQEENYDEFKVPGIRKEYKAKFNNLDNEEREMTWTNQPPSVSGRRRVQDVVKGPVKVPLGKAKDANTPLAAFELFLDDKIISQIVKFTNRKIQSVRSQFSQELLRDSGPRYNVTDVIELRAFIGLCYLRGILRVSKQNIKMLFGPDGHHAFGATMSVKRFAFLNSMLSFDEPETRAERKKADKFAVMRDFFEAFNKNCGRYLAPPVFLAIDETLYPTRGQIGFKQYIHGKPDKFGINFKSINSVEVPYSHSIVVSAGKPENGEGPHYTPTVLSTVQRLVSNLKKRVELSGRNISTDNYYTSLPCAEYLMRNNITTIGTMRANRQGIPKEVKDTKGREQNSYQPYWDKRTGKVSLHSYVVNTKSKGERNILVLSTFDPILGTTKDEKKKPAIIKVYDFTKGGTDIMDQRFGNYTTKSKTKKWTKVVFFFILDTTRVNAQTIYYLVMGIEPRLSNSFEFAMKIVRALIIPHIENRPLVGLTRKILNKMTMTLGRDIKPHIPEVPKEMDNFPSQIPNKVRKRCKMCASAIDSDGHRQTSDNLNRVTTQCCTCGNAICKDHYLLLCINCAQLFTFQNPQKPENNDE